MRAGCRIPCTLAALALAMTAAAPVFAAETKSYVASWLHVATYAQEDDCPQGTNPSARQLYTRILHDLGITDPAEVKSILTGIPDDGGKDKRGRRAREIGQMRGRIDGKEVNVYAYPYSVPDPQIHLAEGRYANGFNLDGKPPPPGKTSSIEDPDTHEVGIDNELRRAMGCSIMFHTRLPDRPGYPANEWDLSRDQMPAWLLSVTGDDLSKDGVVTLSFARAVEPVRREANGDTLADTTFHIDPDAGPPIVAHGRIVNGILTSDAPFRFAMTADPGLIPDFVMDKAHIRLDLTNTMAAAGYIGGYQPWISIYYMFANLISGTEIGLSVDLPGLYYAMKKLADYDPDPHTGQNRAISSTYRIEYVRAFAIAPPPHTAQTARAAR